MTEIVDTLVKRQIARKNLENDVEALESDCLNTIEIFQGGENVDSKWTDPVFNIRAQYHFKRAFECLRQSIKVET
jgi:hypothetical protein